MSSFRKSIRQRISVWKFRLRIRNIIERYRTLEKEYRFIIRAYSKEYVFFMYEENIGRVRLATVRRRDSYG